MGSDESTDQQTDGESTDEGSSDATEGESTDDGFVEATDSEATDEASDGTDVGSTDESADETDGQGGETDADAGAEVELERLIDDPLADFPERISRTGIYPDPGRRSEIAVEAFEYVPRFPLWSNGLAKQRGIVLPPGETLTLSEGQFEFPMGTLIYKTFAGEDSVVETRLLRRTDDDWDYAVYRWDEQGQDAELLDGRKDIETSAETEWGEVQHTIPGRLTCRQCHESSTSFVLGFQPEQLLDADGGLEQLQQLQEAGFLAEVPEVSDPVADVEGLTKDVLGYFLGNCTHCHNGENGIASSYDMRPAAALDNLVGQPTESSATAVGTRVVPGDPSQSVMFAAVSGETDDPEVKLMPPVGVNFIDPEGVELLRRWIESL